MILSRAAEMILVSQVVEHRLLKSFPKVVVSGCPPRSHLFPSTDQQESKRLHRIADAPSTRILEIKSVGEIGPMRK